MYVTSQNGQQIKDIGEYGLVSDTLANLQLNNSVRDGLGIQYGFNSVAGADSQGHKWSILSTGGAVAGAVAGAAGQSETHSYSIPLLSGVVGSLADKMLNIGRTSKLTVNLVTSNILPLTGGTTAPITAGSYSVTLSNFSIQCEYIDIGLNALRELDTTLVNGNAYIHGTTYRTSSAAVPASAGTQSLLCGIRASSVKSIFARFQQNVANNAVSCNGKYGSFNPLLNAIGFSVGGIKFPQSPVNPLLSPSQAFRETQMAIGSFNNSSFQSCILSQKYCRLSAGGTAQGRATGATQAFEWNLDADTVDAQSLFIFWCEYRNRGSSWSPFWSQLYFCPYFP